MADKYINASGITHLWSKIKAAFVSKSDVGESGGVAPINSQGKINSTYIPTASASTIGGVKVGSNLSIDAFGVLNATAASGAIYVVTVGIDSDGHNPNANADALKDIANHEFSMLRPGAGSSAYYTAYLTTRFSYLYYYTMWVGNKSFLYVVDTQRGTISLDEERTFVEE